MENSKTLSSMTPHEIRLETAKRFCDKLQIKEGSKEYKEIIQRNINPNTKTI